MLSLKVNDKIKFIGSIWKILRKIVFIIDLKAKKYNVKIDWSLANKNEFSDKISLEQIMLNICTNGIEAMQIQTLKAEC